MVYKRLNTERLTLDLIQVKDARRLQEIRTYKDYKLYTGSPPFQSLEEAEDVIEQYRALVVTKQAYFWGLYKKDKEELIGTICLWRLDKSHQHAELGYELHESAHHQGYIKEALDAVVDFAFNQGHLTEIKATTHEENSSSLEILRKKGFIETKCLINYKNQRMRCFVLKSDKTV